jgi:Holliday junction DNA helicase RuvA
MIAQLRGIAVQKDSQQIILDVQGVGYAVYVSSHTRSQVALSSSEVTILTEMQVREDSMTLFGFIDAAERDAFRLLITVQGVGAKAAMAILSVMTLVELTQAIISGDKAMVTRAEGVGPKIALRVVNELSEKVGKIESLVSECKVVGAATNVTSPGSKAIQDALSALTNLGYGRVEAHAALMRVNADGAQDDLSALIAAALREIGT